MRINSQKRSTAIRHKGRVFFFFQNIKLMFKVHTSSNEYSIFKLQSYINTKAFIVTQYPPPEDAVDFLRLLIDHESDTVICMDPLTAIESVSGFVLLCIALHYITFKHFQECMVGCLRKIKCTFEISTVTFIQYV